MSFTVHLQNGEQIAHGAIVGFMLPIGALHGVGHGDDLTI